MYWFISYVSFKMRLVSGIYLSVLALLNAVAFGTTIRKLVGGMPAVDPLDVKILQHGEELVDIWVTNLGVARGLRTQQVDKWLGIPYAMPPIGPRRWKKPEILRSWAAPINSITTPTSERSGRMDYSHLGGDPLNATSFLPSCFSVVAGGSWIRTEPESEDCLSLNVFVPRGHIEKVQSGNAKRLPVVVYIHGGGFILGSGSNPSTAPPPDIFVSSVGVIFVTMNYRLGPFSFIANAAMENFGGMLGIWDQVASMQWVNEYIHSFGGDPDQVTLMGESAGAISICTHLVLPQSRGLFQKAIMESALCGFPFEGATSARETMLRLAEALECKVDADDPKHAEEIARRKKHIRTVERPPTNHVDPAGHHDVQQKAELPTAWPWVQSVVDAGTKAIGGLKQLAKRLSPSVSEDDARYHEIPVHNLETDMPTSTFGAIGDLIFRHFHKTSDAEPDNSTEYNVHKWGRFESMQNSRWSGNRYEVPALSKEEMAADEMMLECMRGKDAEEVRSALQVRRGFMFYSGESFFPVINGLDIVDHPLRLIERGLWAKEVEILYGHNKDEASIFLLFAYPFLMTKRLVQDFLIATVGGEHGAALWDYYVAEKEGYSLRSSVLKMLNDMWACSAHYFAAHVASHGGKIRYFQFQHEPSYLSSILSWLGSFHGVELDFVFGVHQSGTKEPKEEEVHLSREIMRLWAEFATGKRKVLIPDLRAEKSWIIADADTIYTVEEQRSNVDYFHLSEWPLYDNVTQTCLNLKTHPLRLSDDCRHPQCHLWEATMDDGMMKVPPQTPEPYISVLANVWGPKALQLIGKYLQIFAAVVFATFLWVLWKIAAKIWQKAKGASTASPPGPTAIKLTLNLAPRGHEKHAGSLSESGSITTMKSSSPSPPSEEIFHSHRSNRVSRGRSKTPLRMRLKRAAQQT